MVNYLGQVVNTVVRSGAHFIIISSPSGGVDKLPDTV